jgi:hypothetical protein
MPSCVQAIVRPRQRASTQPHNMNNEEPPLMDMVAETDHTLKTVVPKLETRPDGSSTLQLVRIVHVAVISAGISDHLDEGQTAATAGQRAKT